MKTISYYDLLNMVKNNEYPSVYYNCSNGCKILYIPYFDIGGSSFLCYILKNNKEYNEEYARHYLVENILESEMFENNLEIVEDTPKEDKKIEKLESLNTDYHMERKKYGSLTNEEIVLDIQTLKNYINKLVDKVNGK